MTGGAGGGSQGPSEKVEGGRGQPHSTSAHFPLSHPIAFNGSMGRQTHPTSKTPVPPGSPFHAIAPPSLSRLASSNLVAELSREIWAVSHIQSFNRHLELSLVPGWR